MTEIWKLPAVVIASLVRTRCISAREATESALGRLDEVNPEINAVVDVLRDQALGEADALDARIAKGEDPGPCAGVPVTVKVNIDVAGRATTNGLRLQNDLIAKTDSPVVENLRRAGSIIIGRTNTPAFSIRWFTRNSIHGATRNPHDAGLTPGGSSGGAAAAVAAGIGAFAHGTDIAGSIRYPAYACGVHGLRPSLGRVPALNDTAPDRTMGAQITAVSGPLARSIADLHLAFDALSLPNSRDPWNMPAALSGVPVPKKAALCTHPDGLDTDPRVADALRASAKLLADAGWSVEEVDAPSFAEAARINMALWMLDFSQAGLPKLEEEGDEDAIFVAGQLLKIAERSGDPLDALKDRSRLVREWQGFLSEWPLLLCPVSGEPPFADHLDLEGDAAFARVYAAQLTQVGLPALGLPGMTVATGSPGKPLGVQLVAGRFREDVLFDAARIIEAGWPPVLPVTSSG